MYSGAADNGKITLGVFASSLSITALIVSAELHTDVLPTDLYRTVLTN